MPHDMQNKQRRRPALSAGAGNARHEILEDLHRLGFKLTAQRKAILDAFLDLGGHPSPEEIHQEVRRRGRTTGSATIYRTVKVFVEAGIARRLEFGDGLSRYELRNNKARHLHLVCRRCGRTFEAYAMSMDTLYAELAKTHAFVVNDSTTCLHGLCAACLAASSQKKRADRERKEEVTT